MDAADLETAVALDTVAVEAAQAGKHSLPLGTPCPNCATALQGGWCHACGQKAEKYDRSIWHLTVEAFEGLTHFDGRFWRTVGRLILKPGQLTRDYLDGHRAPQIPPFRMFLVALLAVFFTGQISLQVHPVKVNLEPADTFIARDPQDRAQFKEAADAVRAKPSMRWMVESGEHAIKDPEALFSAMEHWSHQFAILLLPIAALLLAPMFAWKRGVYLFDHLIFTMHSLSFQGLLLSTIFLLDVATTWVWPLLIIAPIHLFAHMRGAYRIGVAGTLARMAVLFAGSSIAFAALMAGLFFVGLATLH